MVQTDAVKSACDLYKMDYLFKELPFSPVHS
jgi:hypothetical protein